MACNNIYDEIIDSETKWRTEILYKIVLDIHIQNENLAGIMLSIIKKEC